MFVGRLRRFPTLEHWPNVRLYRLKALGRPFAAGGPSLAGAEEIDVSPAVARMIGERVGQGVARAARGSSNAAGIRGG